MACQFIEQLAKMRKLSAESVENTNSFDDFKQYLHVERPVEYELQSLLKEIGNKQEKVLILLCGSAGDGKSHLLSYFKNQHPEHLLDEYYLYNDATESSSPNLTAMDTLKEKLVYFDDEHFAEPDETKMIIAVNLGTLNNFIESKQGANYTKLAGYIRKQGILSGERQETKYMENSVFQHVSFSDYQVFGLTSEGVDTEFLEKLFGKIFNQYEKNPFYKLFKAGGECVNAGRCPIRHNYEFFLNPSVQKAVIDRLISTIIMDRTIVSTRDVLNLIYDLLVHPEYSSDEIIIGTNNVQFLSNYIKWTTPMLLNEFGDISPLLNSIRKYDTLQERSEAMDEFAMRFHAAEDISDMVMEVIKDTPYDKVLGQPENLELLSKNHGLKNLTFRFIQRLKAMKGAMPESQKELHIQTYIHYIYSQYTGKKKNLRKLFSDTKQAVYNWKMSNQQEDIITVEDRNENFWIFEQLELEGVTREGKIIEGNLIQRFTPELTITFKKKGTSGGANQQASIQMNFQMFELVTNMAQGYRPTVRDQNIHAEFNSFVQQLTYLGDKENKITLVPKYSSKAKKYIFEKNEFGYEFKVEKVRS